MNTKMDDILNTLEVANRNAIALKAKDIEDFEYLLHHVSVDANGEETLHHCYLYDHIANIFVQGHLTVRDGKAYLNGKAVKEGNFHVIVGLEQTQECVWSDEDAIANKIKPKKMLEGMSLKQKSKEW